MQLTSSERETLVNARIRMERAIVKTIIEDALDLGYNVLHHDGADITVSARIGAATGHDNRQRMTKEEATNVILNEIMATDEESLIFRKDARRVGSVFLVYGNDGYDVICDYTANDEVEEILKGANELAEKFEEHGIAIK